MENNQNLQFFCNACDFGFAAMSCFKRHLKIHTKEMVVRCPLCNRELSRGDALRRHLRTIHGV